MVGHNQAKNVQMISFEQAVVSQIEESTALRTHELYNEDTSID